MTKTPAFSKTDPSGFTKTLRQRVNEYFKQNNISRYGNWNMVLKTVVMLILFITPLVMLCTGSITSVPLLFGMYIMSGLGMAGIGMGVMHDANHGSYSRNSKVNKALGLTVNLVGANANVWKIQHNMLHHSFTNIDDADEDIQTPFFLRFSPHDKKHWLHQFQHIYIWFFYSISTLFWVTGKDFVNVIRYRKKGLVKSKGELRKKLWSISGWKVFYFSYALALPLIMIPLASWLIILAFLSMHVVTGILLSMVFQTAHVMPDVTYPLPDKDGLIGSNWTLHQLVTTTNYAPRNRVLTWFAGGLNFQVEHHLLPNVCHVHYKRLSSIVAETAHEYGVPYNCKETFFSALRDHIKMLRYLGRAEPAGA